MDIIAIKCRVRSAALGPCPPLANSAVTVVLAVVVMGGGGCEGGATVHHPRALLELGLVMVSCNAMESHEGEYLHQGKGRWPPAPCLAQVGSDICVQWDASFICLPPSLWLTVINNVHSLLIFLFCYFFYSDFRLELSLTAI